MGLFDILKKKTQPPLKSADSMMWYTPHYNTYNNYDVYNSDVVLQAMRCILQEVRKLEPRHIIRENGRHKICWDSVQYTLEDPNELMITADFLEKVVYNLLTTNNSWVLPTWEDGHLAALYPLQPTDVHFVQDVTGKMFVDMKFANNYEARLRYSDLIHVRHNFGASEFMGGNVEGKADIKAIQKGVNLNESLLDGIQKSIKSSYAVNGVVKYNTMLDDGTTEKALKELTEKLNNNENGFMPLDLKGEFIPFNRDVKIVDESTLNFADSKVLRNWGISNAILTGDFTTEQYESFYQKVLEPIVITLNQAFTKGIFTREGRTVLGHKIIFYTSELKFMSMNNKKDIAALLSNSGAINVDELRETFGFSPCEDEELGKTYIQSKNFGDSSVVKDQIKNETDAIKALAEAKNN